MPQIWLTYDELAVLLDCNPAAARDAAASIPLDRRRSRDGHTRAKLSPALTEAFLDAVLERRLDREVAGGASDLRSMHDRMARRTIAAPRIRAFVAR